MMDNIDEVTDVKLKAFKEIEKDKALGHTTKRSRANLSKKEN
jgi:hypothetical protein